jgi:glycosyltransferase involved in cell wall biosynthesis
MPCTDTLPLVSIVTPSLNQARFLSRTIDSVLGQTYPHIEYFVADGGSRDESLGILRSYGERFRWVSEPDRGQADAINKGFSHCRGQIRGYLNSDDVLLPDAVAAVVRHFRAHPDWDMVYGRGQIIDAEGQSQGYFPTEEFSFPRLLQICFVCQPATFWRTEIADRIGPFNERLQYVMDYEYWLRIHQSGGRIVHIGETLAQARDHPACKTRRAQTDMLRELFDVCLEQVGRVDFSHLLAYWHYRCHRSECGWPRYLRRLPGFPQTMANIHFRWLRNRKTFWPFCRDLARGMTRRLGRSLS